MRVNRAEGLCACRISSITPALLPPSLLPSAKPNQDKNREIKISLISPKWQQNLFLEHVLSENSVHTTLREYPKSGDPSHWEIDECRASSQGVPPTLKPFSSFLLDALPQMAFSGRLRWVLKRFSEAESGPAAHQSTWHLPLEDPVSHSQRESTHYLWRPEQRLSKWWQCAPYKESTKAPLPSTRCPLSADRRYNATTHCTLTAVQIQSQPAASLSSDEQ